MDANGTGMGAALSDLMMQYLSRVPPQARQAPLQFFMPSSPAYGQAPPDPSMLPPGIVQFAMSQGVPLAPTEDSNGVWDARRMGNGSGASFVTIPGAGGQNVYFDDGRYRFFGG